MSLLLDHGHSEAQRYPLGLVFDEAHLVEERVNSRIITEAQLAQLGVHSLLSKKARSQFSKLVKQLNVVVTPIKGLFD